MVMRRIVCLLAFAASTAIADTSAAPQASTATAPAPSGYELTLVPPAESSDKSYTAAVAEPYFVPHSSADIDLSLEEARSQPAGIFPYGPVSLVYLSKQDVWGVALAWGEPAKENLFEQYTAETFYRIQLSPANQFSVGYQVVLNPALAPHDETVGVFWARFRILF
jgi:hypothetical protein